MPGYPLHTLQPGRSQSYTFRGTANQLSQLRITFGFTNYLIYPATSYSIEPSGNGSFSFKINQPR
jgi:hypothetical protein